MSELKHNFVQGRMNKDLDERIVPNGEYRDATNIQVSSSEDSEVGTIQNILGNVLVDQGLPLNYLPDTAVCIGTVADEKNNALYFFVQDSMFVDEEIYNTIQTQDYYSWRDLIIEYKDPSPPTGLITFDNGKLTPVFTDTHTTWCRLEPSQQGQAGWATSNYRLTIPTSSSDTYHQPTLIKPGAWVWVTTAGGPPSFHRVLNAENYGGFTGVELDTQIINPSALTELTFYSPKVLFPWDPQEEGLNYITGINIVDDFLFWTDNFGEPKKINIKDSIKGTRNIYGLPPYPTCLAHKEQALYDNTMTSWTPPQMSVYPFTPIANYLQQPVEEQHITVIKKSPKTPPLLEMFTDRDEYNRYSAVVKITDAGNVTQSSFLTSNGAQNLFDYDFTSFTVGDIIYLNVDLDLNLDTFGGTLDFWQENYANGQNTSVVLAEYNDQGSQPSVPITDYRIKGVIVNWEDANGNQLTDFTGALNNAQPAQIEGRKIAVEITSIDGFPPVADPLIGQRLYVIDSFLENEKLFEFKFPRFAYRWKYKDGEYSCFSPFSEIAFLPGSFDYHPKKGYNLGMTNNLKHVNITNYFNYNETPDDVVEIDILYKEEESTNIYVVKTLKLSDYIDLTNNINTWGFNSFKLSSETVQSTISSNQLLRSFDNVPRKALAQEVIGNRIIYGNYLQNFNLIDSDTLQQTFDITGHDFYVKQHAIAYSSTGTKSIKSLREYQLGVVFSDEYDRQTPVVSHGAATMKLDKSYSWQSNSFSIEFSQSYPVNMDRFKFFIKETDEEYYNMAMDRFYDAEDGNIWLAFASSDRNKIDIDTFLVLKKGLDEGVQVTESARYKVLAIENEAPDFIKTSKLLICEETQSSATNDIFGNTMSSAPGVGDDGFSLNYSTFFGTSGAKLHESKVGEKLFVEFTRSGVEQVSNRYEITELTCDYDGAGANLASSKFHFKIKGQFSDDVSFITNDATGLNSTHVEDGAQIRVYRYKVENKPQFDGRFFVKIYMDQVFSKYIKKIYEETDVDYKVVGSQMLYKLPKDFNDPVWTSTSSGIGFDPSGLAYNVLAHRKTEFKSWFQDYKFKQSGTDNTDLIEAGIGNYGFHVGNNAGLCESSYGWTMYYHCLEPGSSFAHGSLTNFNNTSPPAYWFIDEGTYRGWRYNDENYNKFGSFSPSQSVYKLSTDNTYDYHGFGIEPTMNSTDEWNLFLGFGGVHSKQWEWIGNTASTNNGNHAEPENNLVAPANATHFECYRTISDFWTIGVPGGNPQHVAEQNIVEKLVPGTRFRFAEDPEQTIYTLGAFIDQQQLVRYRRNDERQPGVDGGVSQSVLGNWENGDTYGTWYGDPDQPVSNTNQGIGHINLAALLDSRHGTSERINTDFTNPANFTKNWFLKPTPMISWNPVENASGLISNGLNLTITTPNNGVAHVGTSGTGTTCLNCDTTGASSDPNEFCLVLDSILATDSAGNTSQLVKGLVLYSYTKSIGGAVTSPTQNMLIKTIDYDAGSDQYHVYLTGSKSLHSAAENFIPQANTTLKFGQPVMNGFSPIFIENYHHNTQNENKLLMDAIGYTLEFIEPIDDVEIMPENPAVWETEPKENTPLDIYYEASGSLPLILTPGNIKSVVRRTNLPGNNIEGLVGHTVELDVFVKQVDDRFRLREATQDITSTSIGITLYQDSSPQALKLPCVQPGGCNGGSIPEIAIGDTFIIPSHGLNIALTILDFQNIVTFNGDDYAGLIMVPNNIWANAKFDLHWYNCYSFGNGVESNRIRDNFNLPYIKNGVKVSTTLEGQYKEEHRKHGLIYSGLYNSITGLNNLNQFIQAEKITKDINPIYGSIQKLHARDTDLVTLCEDKVLKILANKDALFNADGNPQLTATNKVLGQSIPFVGEYGISKNPESFASESYRAYFSDKVRGVILRLSRDGLTPISDHGMRDWFRDRMKVLSSNTDQDIKILGSYDDRQNEYNVTFSPNNNNLGYNVSGSQMQSRSMAANPLQEDAYHSNPITVSFAESSKGWVSFKSFVPENANSANNDYFTFQNGRLWKHHIPVMSNVTGKTINYNTFYGEDNFFPSTFTVLLNGIPDTVKSFKTLNYEGSQSRSIKNIEDNQYHNLTNKKGWYVDNIFTNKEQGNLKEFIEKEGKWFNYITGKSIDTSLDGHLVNGFDSSAFAVQGLGMQTHAPVVNGVIGCMDPDAFNYDEDATISCLSCCIDTVMGCTDTTATNYDPTANSDDGSCIIMGCTDDTANNYNPDANTDDGSCNYVIWGCTDPTAYNYDPNATNNDGSCFPVIIGCMDTGATNYNLGVPFANNPQTDVNTPCDGSNDPSCSPSASANCCCIIPVLGCTDGNACNFSPSANTPDPNNPCQYCNIEEYNSFNQLMTYNLDPGQACGSTYAPPNNSHCRFCENTNNTLNVVSTTHNSAVVEWVVPTTSPLYNINNQAGIINNYTIQVTEVGTATTTYINAGIIPVAQGQTMQHTITGLTVNTTYNFRISSRCGSTGSYTFGQSEYYYSAITTSNAILGCTDNTGTNTFLGAAGMTPIMGYTWGACNYNPAATVDDGSCEYTTCAGCTHTGYTEYYGPSGAGGNSNITGPSPAISVAVGYCSTLTVIGCTDATAINYNPNATTDDGSCCYIGGCMDDCANNYNPNACIDDGSCTYGELYDGSFQTTGGSGEHEIPEDLAPYNNSDVNGNGLDNPMFFNRFWDMWWNGGGQLPYSNNEWFKFHTPTDNVGYTPLYTLPTFENKGPLGFVNTAKLLFEPGVKPPHCGFQPNYHAEISATGVYQSIDTVLGEDYEVTIVVDNVLEGFVSTAPNAGPQGNFQIMVCDGKYKDNVPSTLTAFNTSSFNGGFAPGCQILGWATSSYMFSLHSDFQNVLDANGSMVTGVANHMPDGVNWSVQIDADCPSATNPGSGPCNIGGNTGNFAAFDMNTSTNTRQKILTLPFKGMGASTIIYIGYLDSQRFYDYVNCTNPSATQRAGTSSMDIWSPANNTRQSSKAAEVSLIQVINVTNGPCVPSTGGGGSTGSGSIGSVQIIKGNTGEKIPTGGGSNISFGGVDEDENKFSKDQEKQKNK